MSLASRGWLRTLGVWLVLLLACWGGARAQVTLLELPRALDRQDLTEHLAVLSDETRALKPDQVLMQRGWEPASRDSLNPGLTGAVIWLRLELINQSSGEDRRWISMGNPRLEEVHLYRVDDQSVTLLQQAGLSFPQSLPLTRGLDAVLELTLAPGERATFLLQVQSRTSIVLRPEIWHPLAYLEQGARDDLLYMVPIALTAGLGLYLIASNLARRSLPLFMLAAWLLIGVTYDFSFHGYLRRFLLPDGSGLAARLPLALGILTNLMLVTYVYLYLEMGRRGPWRLFFQGAQVALGLLLLASLLGPLRPVISLTSVILILLYLVWPFALVQPWREGFSHVRLFTLAMACVWLFTMIRMAHYLGQWRVPELYLVYLGVCFKLVVALVLLYGAVRQAASESRALAQVQSELLAAQGRESERLEDAVRVRSAALQQAAVEADEAVRAKGELLARVGHDLRAPLSTIMAYAKRLEAAGGVLQQQALEIGRKASEQLGLINGLIEYARAGVQPDAIVPQALYLKAWLGSVTDQAHELARRHENHFEIRIQGELPDVVLFDAKRVRQVLLHMLGHAAERTCRGQISLEVNALPGGQLGMPPATSLSFIVRDDGPAIPLNHLPTIFKPFLRLDADQAHREVGLGLAIAHQWSERMGGSLQVLGQPVTGATLRFMLSAPIGREADIAPRHLQRREAHSNELRGEGLRLWVAEDSEVVREMLVAELSRMGFEVRPLADGRQALDCLRDLRLQAPDLLLTDLKMPGVDGWTLLRSARARWPGLPVVLLTSAPEVVTSQSHDFSAVLSKPASLDLLRQTLARLLGLQLIQGPAPEEGGSA
jgi:two-component system, sensor histidine kinase LadS